MSLLDRFASTLRGVVPAPIWDRVTEPYRDWRFSREMRRNWLARNDSEHIAMYWRSLNHPNRTTLIDVLGGVIDSLGRDKPLRVLEFGCHAGMNFRLLHDRYPQLALFGVEPNHDAAEFVRGELPFVKILGAEDDGFIESDFPSPPAVDISFVNVVFYAVQARRARAVIQRLCRSSEVVVLGEQLANTGERTRLEREPAMYTHPYASWLRAEGFTRQTIVAAPEQRPQLSGFLVARRG